MRRFASLRRREDFGRLRRNGRRIATANFTVFCSPALPADALPLVGISVSGRLGSAVTRNRIRRRIAACLHELLTGRSALRLLVVPRLGAERLAFKQLCDELAGALVA